ncbi:hypothetical protein [Actinomadura hibisca]|uniref:hypothetical protein n=1 Tax=Actinomadura hibisca TaxID=68565 RepID=UPI00083227C6|nr:hypothetical protein [Actinomadura hibisca]
MEPGEYAERHGWREVYVMSPGDVYNTRFLLVQTDYGCLGAAPGEPNMACASCGLELGFRTQDCNCWSTTELLMEAVRAEESPAAEEWPDDEPDLRGATPIDSRGDLDWLWYGRLAVACAAVLVRCDAEPIYFGTAAEPLLDLLDGALSRTAFASLAHPARDLEHHDGPALACAPVGRPLDRWITAHPAPIRLLGLVPQDRSWQAPAASSHVRFEPVPVEHHVWDHLVDRPRSLAATRWGKRGLAEQMHREEPEHRPSRADTLGHGVWHGRYDLWRWLDGLAPAEGSWLRELSVALLPWGARAAPGR